MMYLFLDSQIWLDLYHFSNDDLDQFGKLHDMIGNDVDILLTEQIVDEVNRNRENKIKDALKQFKEINIQVPNLCKGYEEYQTLRETIKCFNKIHKQILIKVDEGIKTEQLHADQVISKIFDKITVKTRTRELINKSIIRYNLGNPPGKDKKYGDSINWEALLEYIPNGTDLFLVSSDKDYRSPLNDSEINRFLKNEWKTKKRSDVFFYTSLTMFLNDHLKDIQLKTENIKNGLIEKLRNCSNFSQTHDVVYELSEYSNWTDAQAIALLDAAANNNQIFGIMDDFDIKKFYSQVIKDRLDKLIVNKQLHWILELAGHLPRERNLKDADSPLDLEF